MRPAVQFCTIVPGHAVRPAACMSRTGFMDCADVCAWRGAMGGCTVSPRFALLNPALGLWSCWVMGPIDHGLHARRCLAALQYRRGVMGAGAALPWLRQGAAPAQEELVLLLTLPCQRDPMFACAGTGGKVFGSAE